MKKLLLITAMLIFGAPYAQAADWHFAPGPSSVKFKVNHLVFMEVEGKFKEFEGKVVSPKTDGLEDSKMQAKIDVSSIYTGIDDRDKHLNSNDFFYSEKYPEITFESHSVKKISEHNYIINGNLTIRGVTRPIEFHATSYPEKKLSNGKIRMNLDAKGSINRFDYGLHWNELIESGGAIVGQDVEISLKLALLRSEIS